jgi:hypothetical protein
MMRATAVRSFIAFAVMGALVAGCSMTLPVRGTSEGGEETFSGSATGYMDGSGTLEILSSKGASCAGDFVYVTSRQGQGTFTCTDGRSGPFEFVSTGRHGTGTARLGEQRFTFTFG